MENFIAGDHVSFEVLIIKHRQGAIAFAKRYIHEVYIAEDIVQESFADIYVYRHRYKFKYSFKTYLYTVVKNKSIDYLRKNRQLVSYQVEEADTYGTEQIILDKEHKNILSRAINTLKAEYRTVIYLYAYEDLSYEEIAGIMGKSLAQIKILLYRARQSLKNKMEREE